MRVLSWMNRRLAKRLLILGVLAVAVWLLGSFAVVYRLTRRSQPPFAEPAPEVHWAKIEWLQLTTADNEVLGAWFAAGREERPSVLLLHGNGKSRTASLPQMELFAREGCSVLAVSLRAHGDSTGDINDFGLSARLDVLAAMEFLEKRRPGQQVMIQGTSLGAAAAIFAGEELGERVSAYILECPYRDLRTAVRNRTSVYLFAPLDSVAYAGLSLVGPLVLPDIDRIAPFDHIAKIPVRVPILLMSGSRDDRARPEQVEEMHRQVSAHARLLVFDDAGHEGYCMSDPDEYRAAVLALLEKVTKRN
ncbi:MAG: alpha/beta hydrolase [Gemmataceae bacterium]|nr:alpha/beta hydrolase [Gemmataceae bacterium]